MAERLSVILGGRTIASTIDGFRVLETRHSPTYYVPPPDVAGGVLRPPRRAGVCEWKGRAVLFDATGGGRSAPGATWAYPDP